MTTPTPPEKEPKLIACAGDGGMVPRADCKMVWMRVGMTFRGPAVPLCSACRKALKSAWRYAI